MPDPIPGSTPEEEISPQIDLSIIQLWTNKMRNKDLSEEDEEKLRQEYVNQLESIYKNFTSQYGEVKATTLRDFLVSRANLGDLLSKHEEYERSNLHYDLGYRLLIDAIINSDELISEEEKKRIADYFMSRSPYYQYKSTPKSRRSESIVEFTDNYLDKNNLDKALRHLYKKCRKMHFVSSIFSLVGTISPDNRDAYYFYRESLPESYKELLSKSNLAGDATLNPDFFLDILDMIELLGGKNLKEISHFNSETRNELDKEAEEEFFQEAEKEFGGSFRLPESLQYEYPSA